MNMEDLLVVLFVFLVLSIVAAGVAEYRLRSILKRDHPEVWRSLGSPEWSDQSLSSMATLMRFLWRSEYKELGSSQVDQRARYAKVFVILSLSILVVMGFLNVLWIFAV